MCRSGFEFRKRFHHPSQNSDVLTAQVVTSLATKKKYCINARNAEKKYCARWSLCKQKELLRNRRNTCISNDSYSTDTLSTLLQQLEALGNDIVSALMDVSENLKSVFG